MKVKLLDIPPHGLIIKENLALKGLAERMGVGGHDDIEFLEGPRIDVTVLPSPGGGAELQGSAAAKYRQLCGRCSEAVPREAVVSLNFMLAPKPDLTTLAKDEDPSAFEDDVGVIFYENDEIDLEMIAQEELILSLSIYWSPEEDQTGKCVQCHKHVPTTLVDEAPAKISLADLLKKAGVN